MPDWKVHLIFGILLLVLFLNVGYVFSFISLSFQELSVLVFLVMFASIFPDVDIKQSKSRKMLSIVISLMVSAFYVFLFPDTWYYSIAYFFILYFLIRLFPTKHRGITHTFKFSLVFSILVVLLVHFAFNFGQSLYWFLAIFMAYSLHLLIDKF